MSAPRTTASAKRSGWAWKGSIWPFSGAKSDGCRFVTRRDPPVTRRDLPVARRGFPCDQTRSGCGQKAIWVWPESDQAVARRDLPVARSLAPSATLWWGWGFGGERERGRRGAFGSSGFWLLAFGFWVWRGGGLVWLGPSTWFPMHLWVLAHRPRGTGPCIPRYLREYPEIPLDVPRGTEGPGSLVTDQTGSLGYRSLFLSITNPNRSPRHPGTRETRTGRAGMPIRVTS